MERFKRLSHSVWDCKYHVIWISDFGIEVGGDGLEIFLRWI